MRYSDVVSGIFVSRPNRFIALVSVNGREERCHVKNTGRCREILVPGAKLILQKSDNEGRKTKYDVIAVYKGKRIINIDSQVPNAVVAESIRDLGIIDGIKSVRRETSYGNSRFDLFVEADKNTFVEVKGVTLEDDGVVMFPDAPTERGLKHVNELVDAVENGFDAIIFLVIQMSDVRYFTPNYATDSKFGRALENAAKHGVKVIAYDCDVKEDSIEIGKPVEIRF